MVPSLSTLLLFTGAQYSKVDSKKPQVAHNKGQRLPRLNTTLTINMTHLASEIQAYLETW
jgi:hypothetical protein